MICFLYFLFGAAVGSFINVVAHRVPRRKSLVYPPSSCPSCGKRIRWYENVPVISWILLDGRCSGCGEKIDLRYPLTELTTGLLFATIMCVGSNSAFDVSRLMAAASFLVLYAVSLIDVDRKEIYDGMVILAAVFAVLSVYAGGENLVEVLEASAAAAGIYAAVRLVSGYAATKAEELRIRKRLEYAPWTDVYHPRNFVVDAFGEGDVFIGFAVGALVGAWGAVVALLFASTYALVAVYADSLTERRLDETGIPFAPFLMAGALTVYLLPETARFPFW